MKKKILLVGGCGFIGHNLAIELSNRGHKPYVIDSLAINNIYSIKDTDFENKKLYTLILNNRIDLLKKHKIPLKVLDARDYHLTSQSYSDFDPDVIVHLAAISHANKSNKDPKSTFDHSLRTLENTLDFARSGKKHVIYLSSSMVYGEFQNKTVVEDQSLKPIGIYGTLKLAGELMVKSYYQVFDMPYTIIRPSALYGERCVSRRVGQIFIENSVQGQEIKINGDGEDKLDFTYISDLVNGIISCCENKNSLNETFNITFGNSRKINELIKILKSEFPNLKFSYKEREKFMPERGTLDISKAKKLIGYSPAYSLENGYKKYISWYKNFYKEIN